MSGEFNFECDKCPRTFKLEEFYEKHKKVHELKKQHRCDVCGFVYGAAKGLEGHVKTHTDLQLAHAAATQRSLALAAATAAAVQRAPNASSPSSLPSELSEPAFPGFPTHLNPKGVLAQAKSLSPKKENNGHLKAGHFEKKFNHSLVQSLDKAPSPAGTGNYEIYADAPDIKDANNAVQNDSGFFMCSICTREFSGLNSLKKHVPIHTRRIQHKCDVCGYVFGKKEYLLDHMRKHTGEVSPVCDVCDQTFNKSLKLKEHFKLHRNVAGNGAVNQLNPFRCHICKNVFSRPELLGLHLNSAHAETVYKCDICEATFGDVRGKNHHMYNEHQLDAFHQKCVWCPVCNQGFTRHYNLKVHMYKSHGKDYIENNFSAAELAALIKPPPGTSASGTARASSSANVATINNITQSNQLSATKLTEAMMRSKLAKLSPELPTSVGKPAHYFDQGKGTQMLSCQMCPQQFHRKSDLYIHLDSDHGVILYGCTSCDDKFLDIMDLQDHVSLAHPGKAMGSPPTDEPRKVKRRPGPASKTNAPIESRGSSSSKVLADIVKNLAANAMANAIPIQKCEFCSKILDTPMKLRDHILNIHIKGFHYTCDLCDKAFPHQDHLDAHYKEKHPNLSKRAQNIRNALGLVEDAGPPSKRARYNPNNINSLQGTLSNTCNNNLPSSSILGCNLSVIPPSAPPAHLSSSISSILSASNSIKLSNTSSPIVVSSKPSDLFSTSKTSSFPVPILLPVKPPQPLNLVMNTSNNNVYETDTKEKLQAVVQKLDENGNEQEEFDKNDDNNNNNISCNMNDFKNFSSTPTNNNNTIISITTTNLAPSHPNQLSPDCNNNTQTVVVNGTVEMPPQITGVPPVAASNPPPPSPTVTGGRKKSSSCPVCGVVLSPKTNVNVHLRTHSGVRPYECALCLNRFRQKAHLMKHFRCSHNQKKPPHICSFCPLETVTSNDLYRHITDKHVKETDDMRPGLLAAKAEAQLAVAAANQAAAANAQPNGNGLSPASHLLSNDESNNNVGEDLEDDIAASPSNNGDSSLNETPESPSEVMEEDDVRYEAITEPFLFEEQVIYPCYVTLPYVTDELVEATGSLSHAMISDEDEDEEAPLTIDESISEDDQSQDHIRMPNNLSNSLQMTAASLLGLAANGNGNYNSEDITPQIDQGFYPAISDFSLPFSLSNIWKKKAELLGPAVLQQLEHLEKVEAMKKYNGSLVNGGMESREERMEREQKSHSVSPPSSPPRSKPSPASAKAKKKHVSPHLSHQEYSPNKKSPRKPAPADNAVVSDYEVKIQNDHWPIQCIKCNLVTGDLENFNLHMNDHWSEDKCCPVCGLLINSKRFNFKQHLKIHTGEKPFVCNICNRSFRQKAHMVKHVTTHRTMPNGGEMGESPMPMEVK